MIMNVQYYGSRNCCHSVGYRNLLIGASELVSRNRLAFEIVCFI